MDREDLLKEYVELMGDTVENDRIFYKTVAFMTEEDIISNIIALAHYYKDENNE